MLGQHCLATSWVDFLSISVSPSPTSSLSSAWAKPSPRCLFQLEGVAEKTTYQVARAGLLSLFNQSLAAKWGFQELGV